MSLPLLALKLSPLASSLGPMAGVLDLLYTVGRYTAGYFVTGLVVYAVFNSLRGQDKSIEASLRRAAQSLLNIAAASILLGIAIFFGFLACIIPGIIVSLIFAVAVPAVVVEGLGPIEGMKRSKALTAVIYHDLRMIKDGVALDDLTSW